MEVLSHRHDSSLSQPPASLSFPEGDGGWGKGWGSRKFQASNHGLVFLVTSLHPEAIQEPIKSHLIKTKDTSIIQEMSRGVETLNQQQGSKTKY